MGADQIHRQRRQPVLKRKNTNKKRPSPEKIRKKGGLIFLLRAIFRRSIGQSYGQPFENCSYWRVQRAQTGSTMGSSWSRAARPMRHTGAHRATSGQAAPDDAQRMPGQSLARRKRLHCSGAARGLTAPAKPQKTEGAGYAVFLNSQFF